MSRSRGIWVPALYALLIPVGVITAFMGDAVGDSNLYIRSSLGPWYMGAFVATIGFCGTLATLWWYHLPTWESRQPVSLEKITITGAAIPAIVFPYSASPVLFIAIVLPFITVVAISNGISLLLLLLAIPILGILIHLTFGRCFIGLAADGLMWRVMPDSRGRGAPELRLSDIFRRQQIQFIPWDAIKAVDLVMTPNSATRLSARKQSRYAKLVLRVSLADWTSLANLTYYQHTVHTDSSTDLLIPIDRFDPKSQDLLRYYLTCAAPEKILEAINFYLTHPDERVNIGKSAPRTQLQAKIEIGNLPAVNPMLVRDATVNLQDPLPIARRIGQRAATTGENIIAAWLALPPCLVIVGLFWTGYSGAAVTLFFIFIAYLLLVVLPCAVGFSATVAAFMAPVGTERISCRVSGTNYVSGLSIVTLAGLLHIVLHMFHSVGHSGDASSALLIVSAYAVSAGVVVLATICGFHWGCRARQDGSGRTARWLAGWSKYVL